MPTPTPSPCPPHCVLVHSISFLPTPHPVLMTQHLPKAPGRGSSTPAPQPTPSTLPWASFPTQHCGHSTRRRRSRSPSNSNWHLPRHPPRRHAPLDLEHRHSSQPSVQPPLVERPRQTTRDILLLRTEHVRGISRTPSPHPPQCARPLAARYTTDPGITRRPPTNTRTATRWARTSSPHRARCPRLHCRGYVCGRRHTRQPHAALAHWNACSRKHIDNQRPGGHSGISG